MLLQTARKVVIGLVGGSVVLVGIVMIVAPGPAFIVIPLGLAILATEFAFAAKLLKRVKQHARAMAEKAGVLTARPPPAPQPVEPAAGEPRTPPPATDSTASQTD